MESSKKKEEASETKHRELILGGPGCGKTTRLLQIVGKHIAEGVSPQQIAYVAFTRKAALEARERACLQFGCSEEDLPYFRTLHSFAFKELNISHEQLMTSNHYNDLGNSLKLKFGVLDDEFGLMADQYERGSQYYYIEQQARLRCIDLKKMCLLDGRQGFQYVDHYKRSLETYKKYRHLFDYTDILEVWEKRIGELPIKVLVVDEAQDLSLLQWKVVHKLERSVQFVYYAGDDDQAIYHWAGADIQHFLTLNAVRTILPISYRLPKTIFAKCDAIANRIRNRYSKEWKPTEREGCVKLVYAPEMASLEKGEWLILARNHYYLDQISYDLKVKGFSFIHKGKSSLSTPDALAVKAWLRAQNSEYVSYGDLKRILVKVHSSRLKTFDKNVFSLEDSEVVTRQEISEIYGLDFNKLWQDFLSIKPSEKVYLHLVLKKEGSLDHTPRIRISTIHAVKGGECDNVLLMPDMSGASYESFLKQPDSESRVFYVGASRAKEQLVICQPQSANYFPL